MTGENQHELLERHYERIRRYVVNKVGADRADDIIQHVFLKAHENLPSFRHESELYTWLFKIAQNTIINDNKRSYRTKEISTDTEAMYRFISADFTDEVDFQLDVGTALRHLDAIDQQIISLRFAAGLPFSDISDQLELNESTVKNRLYRCIGKMKPMLENWYSPDPWPAKPLFIMVNMFEQQKHREQDDRVMDDILRTLKKNVRRVTDMLNYVPTHKITYEIYPNIGAFHQSLGIVDSTIVGNSFTGRSNRVSMVSPLNPGLHGSYKGVLNSALYLLGSALAQQMNRQLPRWLYEGVGNYVGRARRRQEVIGLLTGRMRTDEIPTYQEIMTNHGNLFSGGVSRHEISYTMVDFIISRYGFEALQRIIREPKTSIIFQKSLVELEEEWRQFVSDIYLSHAVDTTSAAVSQKGPNELVILMPIAVATGSVRNRVQIFQKYARQFEETYPGITVTIETFTDWNQKEYLGNRLRRDTTVDLVFSGYYSSFAHEGLYADLLPFMEEDGMTTGDLYETLAGMTAINGKLTGIPMSPQPLVLIYNKEWFDKAGLAYPDHTLTWHRYFEISEKLRTTNEVAGTMVYGSVTPFDMQFFETVALSGRHPILSPDDSRFTGFLDSDPVVEALMEVLGRINNGTTSSKLVANSFTPPYKALNENYAGMAIGQAGMYFYLINRGKEFGVTCIPKFAQGVQANSVYINSLSMNAVSERKKLAWKFMKEVIIDGNSSFHEDWGKRELLVSKTAVQRLELNPCVKVMYEQLAHACKPAPYQNPNLLTAALTPTFNKLASLQSKESVRRVLAAAAIQLDEQLGEVK